MKEKRTSLHIALLSYEYPPETGFGGIGTYTYYQAHALAKLGHRVHVIAGAAIPKKETAKEDGVLVTRFKMGGGGRRIFDWFWDHAFTSASRRIETAISMFGCLRELHSRDPFDAVEMPECGAEGLFVNLLVRGVPKILKFHSPFYLVGKFYDNTRSDIFLTAVLERAAVRRATVLMAPSTFLSRRVKADLRLRRPVHVVFNGIDIARIDRAGRIDIRKKYGVSQGRRIIACSGRIEKRKGTDLFLEIVPLVAREDPQVLFAFAGHDLGDGMLQSIIEHFQKQGVSENVIFVGRLDFEHLMSLLKTADLFAYPTRWDNCPYSVLEAMVCRCPIVAAGVGGLAEMLDEGRAGVLVPPGDARAFAREIISILKLKDRADALAQSARQRVEHHYDYIQIARDTIHLYKTS